MEILLAWVASAIVTAFAAAFLALYLHSRTENPRPREDDRHHDAPTVRALEQQLLLERWNRERDWHVKRDAILAAMGALTLAYYSLIEFWGIVANAPASARLPEHDDDRYGRAAGDYLHKAEICEHKASEAGFVANDPLQEAMLKANHAMKHAFTLAVDREPLSTEAFDSFHMAYVHARQLAREELGMTPRSDAAPPR